MGITASHLKQLVLSMKTKLETLFPTSNQPHAPTREIDLEVAIAPIGNEPQPNQLQWLPLLAAFCLSSAGANPPQITEQTRKDASSFISLQFHLFRLALVLAVSAMLMARQLSFNFPNGARLMEHAGVLFGITAFFLIVSDLFPLGFKIATWTIYGIVLSVAFFCKIVEYWKP